MVVHSDNHRLPRVLGFPCRVCRTPLASDQRYCLECGTRRAALPGYVAERISEMAHAPRPPLAVPAPERLRGEATDGIIAPRGLPFAMPSPRAAAVAVMSTLAFGAVVGQGAESLATAPPVIVAVGGGSSGGGSGGSASIDNSGVDNSAGAGAAAAPLAPRVITITQQAQATPAPAAPNTSTGVANGVLPPLPPVKHVFLVMLADQGYNAAFGPVSKATYLSKTLVSQGELLPNYYAVAQGELANGVALISGQGPTPQTEADCPTYTPFTVTGTAPLGQYKGSGCVYPKQVQTLAGELTAAHKTWRAYVEPLGTATKLGAATCRHPAPGAADPYAMPQPGDPYVTARNPFVYFSSLTSTAECVQNDVGLTQLSTDLKSAATTPAFSMIVPGACDDGSDTPCAPGAQAGLQPAEGFLRRVIPAIEASPGYKDGGLIAITFDQAPQTGATADPSSCCNNPTYPNLPPQTPGTSTTPGATTTPGSTAGASTTASPAATGATTSTTTTPATTTTTTTTAPLTVTTPLTPALTVGAVTTTTTATATTPGTTTTATTPGTTTPASTTPTTTGTTTTGTTTTGSSTPAGLIGGETSPTGGGGQVGMLVISSYVKPGTTDVIDYFNHFSFLATIETLYSLKRIGYASDPQLPTFGHAAFNAYSGG